MTSLLFVYVVFGPILHILIIQYQDAVCLQQFKSRYGQLDLPHCATTEKITGEKLKTKRKSQKYQKQSENDGVNSWIPLGCITCSGFVDGTVYPGIQSNQRKSVDTVDGEMRLVITLDVAECKVVAGRVGVARTRPGTRQEQLERRTIGQRLD